MNKQLQGATRREQYAIASTEAPVHRGYNREEDRKMSDWLKRRGELNTSPWRRRRV